MTDNNNKTPKKMSLYIMKQKKKIVLDFIRIKA